MNVEVPQLFFAFHHKNKYTQVSTTKISKLSTDKTRSLVLDFLDRTTAMAVSKHNHLGLI